MSFFEAGDSIRSLDDSQPAARIGLAPGTRGYVCHVGEGRISFYLDHGGYGYEGCMDQAVFGQYFRKAHSVFESPRNTAYSISAHFDKLFPEQFP